MEVNRELSERVAERHGARPKGCWVNAWAALQCDTELHGGLYIEGWALTDGDLVFEHGWLELDGEIIDPTLYDRDVAYFPALRFDRDAAKRELARRGKTMEPGDLPIVWRFGWGGCENSEYMAAREKALAPAGAAVSLNDL